MLMWITITTLRKHWKEYSFSLKVRQWLWKHFVSWETEVFVNVLLCPSRPGVIYTRRRQSVGHCAERGVMTCQSRVLSFDQVHLSLCARRRGLWETRERKVSVWRHQSRSWRAVHATFGSQRWDKWDTPMSKDRESQTEKLTTTS